MHVIILSKGSNLVYKKKLILINKIN